MTIVDRMCLVRLRDHIYIYLLLLHSWIYVNLGIFQTDFHSPKHSLYSQRPPIRTVCSHRPVEVAGAPRDALAPILEIMHSINLTL